MARMTETLGGAKDRTDLYGLICGFAMLPDQQIQPLSGDDVGAALAEPATFVWLHLNARISHARDWITRCELLPETSRRFLLENDDRKRLERTGDHLVGVISDIRYDFGLDFDPAQISTLRFHLDRRCMISTRVQPSSAADQLRTQINQGRYFDSTAKLMIHLFESQIAKLSETTTKVSRMLDEIEDQALAGRMRGQHTQLGGIRRLAVRLYHHFAPENRMLQRLCRRLPDWFSASDHADLQDVAEQFREMIDDLTETQERAKLLQEELAARLAEETNNNLYIVSLFTALLLPPMLMAGICGMNRAGLPGLEDPMSFWWVMAGMLGVSLLVLLILYMRRLF